ncbi:MAG: beta strand repeat-containing protein [Terriglobales bacterium]
MKHLGTRGNLVTVLFILFFLFLLTTMLGCGALEGGTPAAQSATGLVATSSLVDFGSVPVGTTTVRTNTITNASHTPIVLTRAQIDQPAFTVTGQKLPLTLAPGQRAVLQIAYSPRSGGITQSKVVLASNLVRLSTTFALKGAATLNSRMKLTPTSMSFGNVQVGTTLTLSTTLSNPGATPVTVTGIAASGKGFSLTGQTLPLTLGAGESATIQVSFMPVTAGAASGRVSVTAALRLNTPDRPVTSGGRRDRETRMAANTMSTVVSASLSGTGMPTGQLAVLPTSLAMGSVRVGTSNTQSATLINSGSSNLTVHQATVSGRGFRMSGLSFPLTLAAGQRKSFTVTFTPQSAGSASGSIAVTSDAPNAVVSVPVTAEATAAGALVSSPASLGFGSVQVGKPQTLSAALTNGSASSVTVSQASVSGSGGFAISGLNLPVTLAAGQSAAFNVTFSPQSGGAASGAVSFASDASNGTLAVPLTANALTTGSLTSSPSSMNFGTVQSGSPQTMSETLTNSGSSSITITQANISGIGFALGGLSLPVALGAGQSTTLNVTFTPQSRGAATGSLSIASNASNSNLSIPLAATAATPGVLSTSDSSLDFGSVQIKGTATQSETLTNTGGANVTITQANVTGTGFSASGLTLPMTLNPGQSFTFGVGFNPASGGNATGSISVVSDASNPTLTITLAGTATVAGQLAVSPATLDFGSVVVGQTKNLTATLTATSSSITVSAANMSTSEFKISGLSLPLTLAAGKSASFSVSFTPQSSGAASASGSFSSNASNSSLAQSLSGTGTAAPQHSVALSWSPSSSSVVGYNVYRGTTTGGPYSKVTSMNADTSYVDSSVQSGKTYFYVTTAVDGTGKESPNSNQTQAVIPVP